MSKVKTAFFCQNCGSQFSKWQGQCSSCKSWNTIVEELITTSKPKSGGLLGSKKERNLYQLKSIKLMDLQRCVCVQETKS